MIQFKNSSPKKWLVLMNEEELFNLELISSSVTNKFKIITDFIERVSQSCGKEFDIWFRTLVEEYVQSKEHRYPTLIKNIEQLKYFVDSYIDSLGFDYNQFVNLSKVKKNTILFTGDEIKMITKMSGYLKIYSVFSNAEKLRLSQRLHKKIYNKLAKDILETEIIFKIFNVIRTKTFRYNLTDKYMWDYIRMVQCKTIDVHVIEIFNFVMNSILILCQENKNPITYFVGVVEESIKWFLRSVYKDSIIYDDSISTEDIHGLNINNLKTYSYNDTLGRLKGIAYEQIYENLEQASILNFDQELDDKLIITFQSRVSTIEYISPLCECFVFPILSELTSVPYSHLRTLSPDHAAVLSVYVKELMKDVFKNDFRNLILLLSYYPLNQPAIATSYTVKKVHEYININNQYKNFFGFNTKILPHKILSYFIGRISRINFCNVIDGSKLSGIPLSKVEFDMIKFYSLFFANQFEGELVKMRKMMSLDF